VLTIGTDPFLAANALARKAKTGVLAPLFGGAEEVGAVTLLKTMEEYLIDLQYQRLGYSAEDIAQAEDHRDDVPPLLSRLTGYKSKQLTGIAFSPPYLHNGSISSVAELLKPSNQRETEFWVGRRQYDPTKLGYISTPPTSDEERERLFLFDTTLPGNSNQGHDFGPAAADYVGDREADAEAIIEYLKTLDVTAEATECH
jgi:hypothetical protein